MVRGVTFISFANADEEKLKEIIFESKLNCGKFVFHYESFGLNIFKHFEILN